MLDVISFRQDGLHHYLKKKYFIKIFRIHAVIYSSDI